MVPCGIIPHILIDHALCPLQFLLREQVESFYQPLPITPDMIVLGILDQHRGNEGGLPFCGTKPLDDCLAVVPDLVVLEMFEGDGVEPGDFVFKWEVKLSYGFCAIQPIYNQYASYTDASPIP